MNRTSSIRKLTTAFAFLFLLHHLDQEQTVCVEGIFQHANNQICTKRLDELNWRVGGGFFRILQTERTRSVTRPRNALLKNHPPLIYHWRGWMLRVTRQQRIIIISYTTVGSPTPPYGRVRLFRVLLF